MLKGGVFGERLDKKRKKERKKERKKVKRKLVWRNSQYQTQHTQCSNLKCSTMWWPGQKLRYVFTCIFKCVFKNSVFKRN